MKTVIALGIFGTAGALSICDLCETGSSRSPARPISAAYAGSGTDYAGPLVTPAAALKTDTLKVEGMTCGGCVLGVRKVLKRLAGVSKADVSYERQRAVVTYDPEKVTVQQMIAAIKTLGYKATVVTSPEAAPR